jgi:hypothetical protein
MRKKKKTGREALEEALRKSFADYHRQFPDSEEEIHLGKDYENYMDGLIRRSKNPTPLHFRTAWGRAACVAAAVLIAFTCSMTVSAVRTPVVNFLTNAYDQFTEILFDDADIEKAPSTIETVYTLGYVPEGYELHLESLEKKASSFVWKNIDGDSVEFDQLLLGIRITVDNEVNEFVHFDVDGTEILFKEKYGKKTYFWNTNEYQFCLYITDEDISTEDGIELIRSVVEYK